MDERKRAFERNKLHKRLLRLTGQFDIVPAGAEDNGISRVFGPFEDPATLPMVSALGMKPEYSEDIKASRLCGSCHTIYLPIFDADGNQVGSDFEQSTYLEWVDFSGTGMSGDEITRRVERDARIAANYGQTFGTGGENFLRFNIATPRARVIDAVARLQAAFGDLQ